MIQLRLQTGRLPKSTQPLDQSQNFTGTVTGFGGQDLIDLRDIAFSPNTTLGYSPNSTNTSGTLSVTDGTRTANIALLGSYMVSAFAASSDGYGGTLIADPVQPASQPLLTLPHS